MKWSEPGLFFRISFIKKNYIAPNELQQELQQESLLAKVFRIIANKPVSRKEISIELGQKSISGQLNEVISRLLKKGLIDKTIEDKPTSPKQKFKISQKGLSLVHLFPQVK